MAGIGQPDDGTMWVAGISVCVLECLCFLGVYEAILRALVNEARGTRRIHQQSRVKEFRASPAVVDRIRQCICGIHGS